MAHYRTILAVFLIVLTIAAPVFGDPEKPASLAPTSQPAQVIDDILESYLPANDIPAIAAAVVRSDGLIATGAVGVRKIGSDVKVAPDDLFHLGSCTKAMTATLCAILVENGKLTWDQTVADTFPDLVKKLHDDYHAVTLEQFLNHRSGLPEDRKPDAIFRKLRMLTGEIKAQRLKLVKLVLSRPPDSPPGSKFAYANAGFAVAAAMAEQATGQSWETLMREMLFEPLGMKTAGFGPPGKIGKMDQPRGHREVREKLRPMEPLWVADNPAVTGPAGNVHCSLADWGKFASLHLAALRGEHRLLRAETFSKLYSDPFTQEYSFGWSTRAREPLEGRVLSHDGSNGMWYARIALLPARDIAILVASNSAASATTAAIDEVLKALYERFGD